jgi:uncharacterized protein DUF6011
VTDREPDRAPEPKTCEVCGRALKTNASLARCRGPVCDEKVSPNPGRDHSPQRLRINRGSAPARPTPAPDGPDLFDELGAGR